MKRLLIGISTLLNVLLLTGFFASSPAPRSQQLSVVPHQDDSQITVVATRGPAGYTITAPVTNAFHWATVESTNYVVFRDNLRAIGCPKETIRDIIEADLRAALGPTNTNGASISYWKRRLPTGRIEMARLRQREATVRACLASLGLPPPIPALLPDDAESADFSFLPADKQAQLAAIEQEFQRLSDERDVLSDGYYTKADLDYLQGLEQQRDAAVRSALTEDQYIEHQLRNSPLAHRIRDLTLGFEPTEDEFRKIYRVEQQVETFTNHGDTGLPEDWRNQQLRVALGEERAAIFLKAQDPQFHEIAAFVERNGLPVGAADSLYQARREAERSLDLIATQNWDEHQKAQAVDAIRQNVVAALQSQLGPGHESLFAEAAEWLFNTP